MYVLVFNHSAIGMHTGCFQSSVITKSASVNVILPVCVYMCVQDKILEVELLFQRVYSFLILIHNTSLPSLGFVTICIYQQ